MDAFVYTIIAIALIVFLIRKSVGLQEKQLDEFIADCAQSKVYILTNDSLNCLSVYCASIVSRQLYIKIDSAYNQTECDGKGIIEFTPNEFALLVKFLKYAVDSTNHSYSLSAEKVLKELLSQTEGEYIKQSDEKQ